MGTGALAAALSVQSLTGAKDQRTGFSLSFLLDFLFISPHCLFINQPGIVSRFPTTSGIHPLCSSFSLSFCLSLLVLPSLCPRIRYNCCWDKPSDAISPFCLWKHPPRLDNMEQSKRYQCSLWSCRAASPQSWPNLTGLSIRKTLMLSLKSPPPWLHSEVNLTASQHDQTFYTQVVCALTFVFIFVWNVSMYYNFYQRFPTKCPLNAQ